jgi:chloramphenicol 3-O phosphotransferase
MAAAQIILLNGSSSSGKSTLARALQRRMDPQPVVTGLDAFVFGQMPPPWHNAPHGVYFSQRSDGAVPIHLGPGGQAMARAFHRSVAAMADCGLSVIVDDVLFEPWLLPDWLDSTVGRSVAFVGVHCELAEAERREVARGDRRPGQVRSHFDVVHAHADYDVTVDTTRTDPRTCAEQILLALAEPQISGAFERLRKGAAGL